MVFLHHVSFGIEVSGYQEEGGGGGDIRLNSRAITLRDCGWDGCTCCLLLCPLCLHRIKRLLETVRAV